MHIYIKLCNQNFVKISFHIFEFDETETCFEIPIRYPSDFGSEPKKVVPFRSDGHPKANASGKQMHPFNAP